MGATETKPSAPSAEVCEIVKAAAKGRANLSTNEIAAALCKQPQTIRKLYCQTGAAYGFRPIKVGRTLVWPVSQIA